jgi:NAD(P)-dependent dehydrogenase (short-subunit alcohol dehydrogenase family)
MDKVALISGGERFCTAAVKKVVKQFGRLDILVNNAGAQIQRTSSRKLP